MHERIINMKVNLAAFICMALFLASCAVAKDEAAAPTKPQQPINAMLAAMAKGDGISESEAKSVSIEVCTRLWGTDPLLKVTECKLQNNRTWVVVLFADNGLDGWGCRIWINKTGNLEKTEYIPGV
jgi:hypothetical protein